MAQKRIKFGIDFETNTAGLNQLKTSLQNLANMKIMPKDFQGSQEEFEQIKNKVVAINNALLKVGNTKLNITNVEQFKKEISKISPNLQTLYNDLSKLGHQGTAAFYQLEKSLYGFKLQAKETNNFLQQISSTMLNAAKWSIAYGAIHKMADSVRQAYDYTKNLDESLNDIRIVTNKSADEMERFAKQANTAAAALGKTTKDYTTASLLYYQQGLSDKEVASRTDVTLKAANVTGQSTQEVSQELTAIWNGYKVSAEEAELYIDKVAAVAATTASNLQELSEGMSKVASAANTMGVDIDQLNAQLSTIISVTRQDAATAGTALKTIYARMTDIESGLDTETTLGEYTSKMAQFGIQVLDSKGALRDVGDVMDEIGSKWDTFTKTQQVALAQAMAGTRQYNNLMALFGNWDKYTESLKTSQAAEGTLQNQQNIYMDSMEAHLNQLTAAREKLYGALFDSESFKDLLDNLTKIVEEFASFTDAIGGLQGMLLPLGALITGIFGPTLATSLSTAISNFGAGREEVKLLKQNMDELAQSTTKEGASTENLVEKIIEFRTAAMSARSSKLITAEEFNTMQASVNEMEQLIQKQEAYNQEMEQAQQLIDQLNAKASPENQISWNRAEAEEQGGTDQVLENINKTTNAINEQQTSFTGLARNAADYVNILKDIKSGEETQMTETEALTQIKTQLKELTESPALSQETKDKLNGLWQSFKSSERHHASVDTLTKKLNALEQGIKNASTEGVQKFEQLNSSVQKSASGIKTAIETGINSSINNLNKSVKRIDMSSMINQFGKLASSTMMVLSAINSLTNIRSIWKNEDLTRGEKIKQTLMAIASAMAMLSPVLVKVTSGFKKLLVINGANAIVDAKLASTTLKENLQLMTKNKLIDEGTKKKLESLGIDVAQLLSDEAYIDTLSDENKVKLQQIFLENLGNNGKKEGIALTFGQMVASKGLIPVLHEMGAAAWASLGPYAIIGAIVAGVYLFIKAISSVVESYKKEEKAVEKANQALQKQTEIYNEIQSAYEKLKSTIEDYKGAQKAIDEMVAGTQEWKDAIQEVNEQVLELMALYPELSNHIHQETKFGITRLILDDEGLEEAQQKQLEKKNIALAQKLQAQSDVRDADNALAAKNLNKKLDIGQGGSEYGQTLAGNLAADIFSLTHGGAGLLINSARGLVEGIGGIINGENVWSNLGKMVPILGSFVRASEAQVDAQKAATTQTENALQILANDYLSRGEVALKDAAETLANNDINKDLIDALTKNTAILKENVIALANNTQANKIANQQIMDAYLTSNNKAYEKETNNAVKQAAAAVSGAQYEKALKEAESRWEDKGKLGGGITDKEAQKAYAKLMGWEWVADKGGNQGEYRKQKEGGGWETFTMSDETARKALAAEDAKKIAADNTYLGFLKQAYNKIAKTDKKNAEAANALMALAGGQERTSLQALSYSQIKALKDQINTFGFELSDAIALGFETIEDLEKAIKTSAEEAEASWKDASKSIKNSSIKNTFDDLIDNVDLSLEDKQKLSNYVGQLGEKGGEFNDFVTGISGENRKKVLEAMANIDWEKDFFASDKLEKTLQNAGLSEAELSAALEYSNTFFNIISDPDSWNFTAIENYFNVLKKVNKAIKEFGDTINKDDYENLTADVQALFTQTGEDEFTLSTSYEAYARAEKEDRTKAITYLESIFEEENDFSKRAAKKQKLENKYGEWFFSAHSGRALRTEKNNINLQLNKTTSVPKEAKVFTPLSDEEKKTLKYLWDYVVANNLVSPISEKRVNDLTTYNDYPTNDDISKIKELQTLVQNKLLEKKQSIDDQIAIYDDYYALGTDKEITQGTFDAAMSSLKQASSQEDIDRITEFLKSKELTEDQKSNYQDALAFAEKQIALLNKQREINTIETQRQIELDKINSALEKQSNLLSKLEKQASVLALSEKARTANLKAQTRAAEEAAAEQSGLIAYYESTAQNALYQKTAKLDDASFALGLLNSNKGYGEKLQEAFDYAQGFDDPDQREKVYNGIKAILDEQNENEKNAESARIELLEKYATAAKAYVAELENISKQWTSLLDAQKSLNDFMQKLAESTNDYAAIGNIYADNYDIATEKYLKYSKIVTDELAEINELKKQSTLSQKDSARLEELQTKVAQNQKEAQNAVLEMQENIKKIEESRLTLGQKINEQYEAQIKNAETQVSVLNHQIKLVKLLRGEQAYSMTSGYYADILAERQNQTVLNQAKYQEAISTYNALVASGAEDELIQKALNDIAETGKAALTSIESTLDAAKQTFEQNVMAVLDEVSNFAATERGIDNYNWQYEFDQNYMSGLDRILNLSNIGIKYQKVINSYVGNETAQKRMVAAYQEVNKLLQQKKLLTENDIALAEKRLALEQARIDLENSQNDTSKMRLVRGTNGEYSYQYVSDQEAILDKQEKYNKALLDYSAQEKKNLKDVANQITKLTDLMKKYAQAETDEAREDAWLRIIQQVGALGESIKGANLGLLPESIQQFIHNWTSQGVTSFNELKTKCNDLAKEYENIKNDMLAASNAITDPNEGLDHYLDGSNTLADKLRVSLSDLKNDFDDPENGLLKKISTFKSTLSNAIDAVKAKGIELVDALGRESPNVVTPAPTPTYTPTPASTAATTTSTSASTSTGNSNSSKTSTFKYQVAVFKDGKVKTAKEQQEELTEAILKYYGATKSQIASQIKNAEAYANWVKGKVVSNTQPDKNGNMTIYYEFPNLNSAKEIIDSVSQLASLYGHFLD